MNDSNNKSANHLTSSGTHYRPDIDGLRAVAVLIVLLFHADVAFPGGFVGVDVFFVISGFLITSLILRDVSKGDYSFQEFWKRRTRRIVPASATMVLVVLFLGYFLLFPSDYIDVGRVSLFQTVGLSNVYFWKSINYFSGDSDLKPLLHTWSLAVEEQFYVLYPLLCVTLLKVGRKQTWIALTFIAVLSLIICELALKSHKLAAFYLLPSRSWELLLGGLVCFLPTPKVRQTWVFEVVSWLAFASLFVVGLTFNESTRFPGISAMAPCLAAACLIYVREYQLTSVHKLLSLSPIVFIGKISYSLYLWHWPILAFYRYWFDKPISKFEGLVLLVSAAIIAFFSWKYIETPVRSRGLTSGFRTTLVKFGILLTCCGVIAGSVVFFSGFPKRISSDAVRYANYKHSMDLIFEVKLDDARKGQFPLLGDQSGKDTCLLWGDSHAMSIAPALNRVCKTENIKLVQATHSSTPPILNFEHSSEYGLNEGTVEFNQRVLDYINVNRPRYVIIAGDWATYANQSGFESKLMASLINVIGTGSKVVFVLDVAKQDIDVPSYLAKQEFWKLPETKKGVSDLRHRQRNERIEKFLSRNQNALAGLQVFDPAVGLVDQQGLWPFVIDGKVMYRDSSHLSVDGAARLEPHIFKLLKD